MFLMLSTNIETVFSSLFFRWEGEKENEVGCDASTGTVRVRVNPKFYRPTEVVRLR